MMPLKAGLAWHPGRNGKGLAPPQVKETRVPAVQFPGVTPLGKAYKVDMTSPPAYPVKVSFPVPASCGDRFEKLVVIKISGDKESLVIPFETDRVQRRATILCRSFSTFIPSVMGDEFDYDTGENICIDLKPAPGCEENPTDIQIQIRGEMTVGTEVRYELSRQGVGMFCPKTDFYRGNYSFENIEGSSEHFQYTSNPETLNFSSDGSNQIVSELNGPVAHGNKRNFPFMIVPENGRLEGRVTDPKGNPLAGIHVELNTAKGLLETHSGAGEKFTFENIFLEDPINQPKESIPYTLRDEELECDPVEGLFKVTGGQTLKTDVVFDGKGFIAGKITDEDGGVLDPVIVIVSPASGDNITYTGSGYYSIGNVPIGRAEVTAMCPQQNGRQAKMIDIKCAASDLDVPSTDFTLNCRDGIVFKIFDNGAFEADSDLHTLQVDTQADITLFLPRGEDQASTEATYDVNHLLRGKAGTTPSYTFTPQAYTISATVRWSVTRKMDRHSLVEYCIRREVVDRAHRDFTVQIHDKGETMAVEMRFDPEIDTALGISPETYYLKKGKKINEFPFEQSYQGTSRLGHAPGLVPGGLRGASQYRATVRILMQEQSSKPPGAERQEPAEAPAEPARNPEESSRISK
ncbi:MAG: carboxypeptidase regulatory-like domain-containing protein [Desulfobacter sp.]|nr:MAG: carboxypeptidase regulatory-like domain-containing protein [Desulfobacter sp.]